MVLATEQDVLQRLSHQLQVDLTQTAATPFQVQCVLRQGDLMVLAQHPPGDPLDRRHLFDSLEQAIRGRMPEVGSLLFGTVPPPPTTQAKLYLRTLGQRHPYAWSAFRLASPAPTTPASTAQEDQATASGAPEPDTPAASASNPSIDPTLEQEFASSLALFMAEEDPPAATEPIAEDSPPARSLSLGWILTGLGVSLVSFGAGLFFMSRPCMVGLCTPLESAQGLSQKSLRGLQSAKSMEELLQTRHQIQRANQTLNQIPAWSQHHSQAVALRQTNQTHLTAIEQMLAIEQRAQTALQKSQTSVKAISDWRSTQMLWQQVIAEVSGISPSSPVFAYAQQQLPGYRQQLAGVNRAIAAEQKAQQALKTAKSTASLAQTRQGMAQSLESLQKVQATWQVAINRLREIPNTTTSFAEAQPLLTNYGTRLSLIRDRVAQEQVSLKTYRRALGLAQKAQAAQQQQKWVLAAAAWRDALAQLNQVPAGTTYAAQADALKADYTTALDLAQAEQQAEAAAQKIKADLNRVCTGSPTICSYAIAADVIRIRFTPAYEKALQAAFASGQTGNYGALGGAVNHVESLQSALQALANSAGVPVEVYDSTGAELKGSFNPGG